MGEEFLGLHILSPTEAMAVIPVTLSKDKKELCLYSYHENLRVPFIAISAWYYKSGTVLAT